MKTEGKNIKSWRFAHGMTQKQLGAELGVTESAISFVESGKRKITPKLKEKMFNLGIFNFNKDTETRAERLWRFYQELLKVGFSDVNAIEIIKTHNIL